MFWQFSGCTNSAVILSLTLVLSLLATSLQLFVTEEGSVLTSAIMTGYATYVCYSAVTLNPDYSCNPTLQSGYQTLSTVSLSANDLLSHFHSDQRRITHVTDHRIGTYSDFIIVDFLQLKQVLTICDSSNVVSKPLRILQSSDSQLRWIRTLEARTN